MNLHNYPTRFLIASAAASLMLFGLCGTVAVFLNGEQNRTAEVLAEDVRSRKAAASLEEALENLAALHDRGVKWIEPIHVRIEEHLAEIERLANKPEEQQRARAVASSYQGYLRLWEEGQTRRATQVGPSLGRRLRQEVLPACRRLRDFNAAQIEESEEAHRRSLRRMSWGLAAVGGLGSLAGLVLGYGLARKLRQTIHQFLIRVQGAADRLGQELPAIEWQREGPLGDGADGLLSRVEQAVRRLQQQEREVRRAERLAAAGQLAAGIAHEVRNPLTSAILLIQTGRMDPGAGGLTDEDLALIEGELQRIESTLRAFLDFARPPKPERRWCDLAAVARDALALVRGRAARQGIAFRLDAPPGGCAIDADREQLRQVILNLVLNALDAMPHGGALCVRVAAPGGWVELAVSDSGPGIAADVLPRLFEPFVSGKETGLGLGLVVSRRIVEDHGGTVRGFNLPQGGACFVVRLPLSPEGVTR